MTIKTYATGVEKYPANSRLKIALMLFIPEYGARPLKRAIQRHVQNLLADAILASNLLPGDTALVDFGDSGYVLDVRRPAAQGALPERMAS